MGDKDGIDEWEGSDLELDEVSDKGVYFGRRGGLAEKPCVLEGRENAGGKVGQVRSLEGCQPFQTQLLCSSSRLSVWRPAPDRILPF